MAGFLVLVQERAAGKGMLPPGVTQLSVDTLAMVCQGLIVLCGLWAQSLRVLLAVGLLVVQEFGGAAFVGGAIRQEDVFHGVLSLALILFTDGAVAAYAHRVGKCKNE
jgi:hypothetical protein